MAAGHDAKVLGDLEFLQIGRLVFSRESRLYKRVCPSVRPWVHPWVRPSVTHFFDRPTMGEKEKKLDQ